MDKTSHSRKSRLSAKAADSYTTTGISDNDGYSSPFGDSCPSGSEVMSIADFQAHAAIADQYQPDVKTIESRKAKTSRRSTKAQDKTASAYGRDDTKSYPGASAYDEADTSSYAAATPMKDSRWAAGASDRRAQGQSSAFNAAGSSDDESKRYSKVSQSLQGKSPRTVREILKNPVLMDDHFGSTPHVLQKDNFKTEANELIQSISSVLNEYAGDIDMDRTPLRLSEDSIREYAEVQDAAAKASTTVSSANSKMLKRGDVSVSGGDSETTDIFDPENNTYVSTTSAKKKNVAAMSDDDFLSALAFGGADIFEDDDSAESYSPKVTSNSSQASKSKANAVSSDPYHRDGIYAVNPASSTRNMTDRGVDEDRSSASSTRNMTDRGVDEDRSSASSAESDYSAFQAQALGANSLRHQAFDALFGTQAKASSDDEEELYESADEVYNHSYGYDEDNSDADSSNSRGTSLDSYESDSEELEQVLSSDDSAHASKRSRTSKASRGRFSALDTSASNHAVTDADDDIDIDDVGADDGAVMAAHAASESYEDAYVADQGAGAAHALDRVGAGGAGEAQAVARVGAGGAVAVEDNFDYDESFTLRDRQRKSLEILNHRGIIVSDRYYDDYASKMRQERMKPFSRDVLLKMNIVRVFGRKGILASKLPGYSPREGQQKFADSVAEAITTHRFLAVEAGTGTGKTFAYLVPPLLAGKTVMVSTKTKALQDQLISKDVPSLFKMLGTKHLHAISLKGQSNYICRYLFDGDGMRNLNARDRQRISQYIDECTNSLDADPRNGKFGEMKFSLKEGARSFVCCDSFLCQEMSSSCPYAKAKRELLKELSDSSNGSSISAEDSMFETGRVFGPGAASQAPAIGTKRSRSGNTGINGSHCFVFAARQEAKERDAVIINHSLFYAALQSANGIGNPNSILPLPDVLIFDEAHTLAEVGREFFKRDNNLNQIKEMVNEVHKVFSNTSISTKSGALGKLLIKIERITDILIRAIALRGEGKHGVANFKYCHRQFKSPFELLRYELFSNLDRLFLGSDSYTMQEIRSMLQADGLTEEGWFEKDLGQLDFGNEKITTSLEDEEGSDDSASSSTDTDFDRILSRSRRNSDDREFNTTLLRRFSQLCTKYGVDYKEISPYASDMDDVITDRNGQPIRNSLFRTLMGDLMLALKSLGDQLESNKDAAEDVKPLSASVESLASFITDFMNSDRNKKGEVKWDNAAWIEVVPNDNHGYNFIMTVCPIDIGPYLSTALRKIQEQGCSIVFTSATITTAHKFEKFLYDIGLSGDEVTQRIVPSPFDYANNACLFTSPSFPAVLSQDRMAKSLKMLESVIDATEGGIFILTTSYSALKDAYEYMDKHYSAKRLILKQGGNLAETMKSFVDHGRAVLIGTSSFWEGVDVPGKALSLVIIDKMPFKQVGDPITKAIEGKLKSKGRNFFTDESLPSAIISLRQGAGRLIRNESDTGALVVLDPRIHTKGYGKTVFDSLPPMTRVTSVSEVLNFLKRFG